MTQLWGKSFSPQFQVLNLEGGLSTGVYSIFFFIGTGPRAKIHKKPFFYTRHLFKRIGRTILTKLR